ncbi:DNA repair protein RecN [Acetobacter sp. AN02]|uniref:DNA repair protein RecN n=1 Tax=Acetobacter sp. AN02 TaxID=2894186 RepID=UPI0024341B56|nr:DNA repair protein RecN [Acetobacter sp. AN02]MDG6094722.1 DNA repair protein RecN [Acetobacter sp. AN02]
MLTLLSIQDVVLIEKLDLVFHPGFTALTGETGAGKSILLDSLGLVLGDRATSGVIRAGASEARITASFDLPEGHPTFDILSEQDIPVEAGEPLILRRVITSDGRSRAWVNDQSVAVTLLRRLGGLLSEIQGQHAQIGLMEAGTHRDLLDVSGGLTGQREAVASAYGLWKAAEAALHTARQNMAELGREEEWLRHAADELGQLAPQADEEALLAQQRHVLQGNERRGEAVAAALSDLLPRDRRSTGPSQAIRSASRALQRLVPPAGEPEQSDPMQAVTGEALAALDAAGLALAEAEELLSRLVVECEADPRLLEQTEERLFALRTAARKYNTTVDGLAELLEQYRERLSLIETGSFRLEELEQHLLETRSAYIQEAERLSAARKLAGARLEKSVVSEFRPLHLEKARFFVSLEPLPEESWNAGGTDQCVFLLAANPGQPPGPIGKVASGGELSRLLLALRLVLAGASPVQTLIFDEIDAGVGGATAAAIGERLHRLAGSIQVMAVTHSPQVAAAADHHLHIGKMTSGGATRTTAALLSSEARLEEIARMLAGDTVTEEARAAARRLLNHQG